MKQYYQSVGSPRFPMVVVLLGVLLLSLDTTLGSRNHDGMPIEVSSRNGSRRDDRSRNTVTRKATKKTTAPSTPTPTLPMFIQRYPEVHDRSAEERDHLYMVYKLYLEGATPDELDQYQTNAYNYWYCCLDSATSTGCQITYDNWECEEAYCGASPNAQSAGINTECYFVQVNYLSSNVCCQKWPKNREGSKAWPWTACV